MAYSDFTFYVNSYKGTLSEAAYSRLLPRATAEIDRVTSGRAKNATGCAGKAVRFAECAVVDELNFQGAQGTGDIVSESNDGISRTYAAVTAKTSRQRITAAADTWLCNTDLCAVPI